MAADCLVFGIDGGGSGCRIAVYNMQGRLVANTEGGPANFTTDPNGATQSILSAIASVTSEHLQPAHGCAHIGLAGIMDTADAAKLANAMPFAKTAVTDDRVTTVAGALGDADGCLFSAGTGSFVAAQTDGVQRFLGGWGLKLGDQASGAWIGLQSLQRTLLAHDGLMPHGDLTQAILADHGGSARALLAAVQDASPADLAERAPRVIHAAAQDDFVASAILQEGADYLMSCLNVLGLQNASRLCLSGGIGPAYRDYLPPAVQAMIVAPVGNALDGAVLLARRLAERQS